VDDTMSNTTNNLNPLETWLHQYSDNNENKVETSLLSDCVDYVTRYTSASSNRKALMTQSHAMIKKGEQYGFPASILAALMAYPVIKNQQDSSEEQINKITLHPYRG
jgi:hypothetical protein